ncbi:MAG: serine/threonine protein kinase [Deltaproteobacteria bacterium]|nr:serine/threonine protein kinase [Deltaproteobacteria bacterium]
MAEIHLAKTKGIAGFEKYVALKMIHPNFAEDEQFIEMLVDEAKIAVQLNHGNIAQTFDLGRVGDTYYITMEFVDGADLYKILRRGSEADYEMPLDVCAFIAKEITSALDHAHRKKDSFGKPLGIVHRDVSPQNVLISYSGEVKLVDFGIAKATMKARQTAVGVIKGKYYYMSPEQAWGDPIDARSDIFSAGIVLYEMMTGQMLYLEEDLHRLLDMARKADIKPPSTLRRGIPPQLERIVMHALAKKPEDRYQNAGDFASDLERFLHAYSPVFTATKLATVIRQIIGEPQEVPEYDVEVRDGPIATHTLNADDLIHDKEEIRDENSVIFRIDELEKQQQQQKAPKVTRQAEIKDLGGPPQRPTTPLVPKKPIPKVAPAPQPQPRPSSKPRMANEQTRQVEPAPPRGDESGLLDVKTPPTWTSDHSETHDEDLENIGERTMVTGFAGGGFMMDVASEEGVDATMVTGGPPPRPDSEDGETLAGGRMSQRNDDTPVEEPSDFEDGAPTVQRDFTEPPTIDQRKPAAPVKGKRGPAPPALAAKIHAPAVSELRKPRASRKTPAGGVPAVAQQPNVLQAIVGAQPSAPMPAPAPARSTRSEDSSASTLPQQPSPVAGRALQQPPPEQAQYQQPTMQQPPPPQQPINGYAGYATDASGLPLGAPTPPPGYPVQMVPGVPPHLQPYAMQQQQQQQQPPYGYYQQPYPQQPVTPGALYQMQPYGAPPPQPMSLTGQLRLFEADEMPSQYKVSGGPRWLKLAIAGVIAISVAAGVTFFIIRATRDEAPTVGSIHIESVPPGAEVVYDSTRLAGTTPMTVDSVPVGTRHEIRVELPRHKPHVETVDIPKTGGEQSVTAVMDPITGKLRVITHPDGAEIYIDGQLRGRAPTTINDIDMNSAKRLELRMKDYRPYLLDLSWPANGEIDIDHKLER